MNTSIDLEVTLLKKDELCADGSIIYTFKATWKDVGQAERLAPHPGTEMRRAIRNSEELPSHPV